MISALLNFARGIRRSSGFKRAIATPKRLKIRLQQKLNRGIFSVELHTNAGFFASMQTIVFILVYCRENSLYPDISAKGGTYGEKTGTVDWFNGLFESIQKPAPSIADRLAQRTTIRTSIIKDEGELGFRSQYDARLSLVEASALFNGSYRPSAAVHAEVQAIAGKIGISRSTLAVHYRGTDKVSESGVAPWSQVCARVAAVAANSPWLTKIFLATDELAFGEYFMNWAFKVPVIAAPAEYMPVGNRPVHFSGHPGLAIGREALVTCLLLARCGFLVKTASYLSGWAKIFNPELPVLLLAPQIGARFFPDRALWNDQQSARESTADPAHPPLRRYFPW